MTGDSLLAEGRRLEGLLRDVLRKLFVYEADDPAFELPVTQLRALGLLSRERLTPTSLAAEMGCGVSAATQLADRLEGAGFLRRVADRRDRRCRWLELTAAGREVVRRRTETRAARAAEALARLAEPERAAVLRALETLLEVARALPAAAPSEDEPL